MRVRIQHKTTYHYDGPVDFGPHIIRLRPATHARAEVVSYALAVLPAGELRWQHDPWGNRIARVTFEEDAAVRELALTVDLALDVQPVNPFDFFIDDRCRELPFAYPDGLETELAPFLQTIVPGPELTAFLQRLPAAGVTVPWLAEVNQIVAKRVRYIIRNEPGIQTSEETLAVGSGSCRDSALLLVDVLRARGLAARFVSGYLLQLADEGIVPGEARGVSADVVDLHAWAEVYVPGAGWLGLDGTSGLLCGEGHVPLAAAVDPAQTAPVAGTSSRAAARFEFQLEIARLGHEPRPRRPYTDGQWQRILAAGATVDHRLTEANVVLTSGGEPTWTSRLHPRAPEWNTEAVGETKRVQGLRLAAELRKRFDPGAVSLNRHGKQYPGESLPRWALDLIWRHDGIAIWRDPALLDFAGNLPGADPDAALALAEGLGKGVARRLGIGPFLHPAYEDPWLQIIEEENLPLDVDPLQAKLDEPEERRRLARLLGRGLGRVIGYALPLSQGDDGWLSGRWSFRRRELFLIPGESPMGLRLPLTRIAGAPHEVPVVDRTTGAEPFDFDPRVGRPRRDGSRTAVGAEVAEVAGQRRGRQRTNPGSSAIVEQEARGGSLRTTLCIEPRDGALNVFLPPLPSAEAFLELVAAIEDAAAELDQPVRLEGYRPPADPRLTGCSVTPDPGVLEVNLPVARSFAEYVALIETVSEAANHAGLTTEKYQLDGRETGSGGGNHLTLGGPSTVESPFLQRPELLARVLKYLQHHPSLSYVFSGLFVGPTSQAPRIDEARHDALYELEIALATAERAGDAPPPWLVDRLFRNLLVDVEGNAHRTEVSIDKLYDPAGLAGRQGLVEFRAFEMPPHERMAAVEMLVARSLVARAALAPVAGPLVRWGTELHDKYALPHYLWRDLEDVVRDLGRNGLPLEADWLRPFVDFRCPLLGRLDLEDIEFELRAAIEPWPTLGEQPTGATTSRYVDSSLERVQVLARGVTGDRYVVTVNGVEVPLRPTGVAGEGVAGVRFRAWQPPNCLQPTIPIQHPLRFEVIDTWGERALGGATYHVIHPEGRGFDEAPLTAFEAAARRARRFVPEGHQPHPARWRRARMSPEHPHTVDLRLQTDSD